MNNSQLNKIKKWVTLPLAALALTVMMGIAMPNCPGQEAMQQKVDSLQTSNMDLAKKVQALTLQLNGLSNDMNQIKQILPQLTNILTTQKTAIDQLDTSMKELKAKGSKKKR